MNNINPKHYFIFDNSKLKDRVNIEAIDVMRQVLTEEEFRGYCKGNMLKYLLRANKKGQYDEDNKKACKYAEFLESAYPVTVGHTSGSIKDQAAIDSPLVDEHKVVGGGC